MPNEFDLIKSIRLAASLDLPGDVVGIGDDCAVWPFGDRQLLLATDMLIGGVHFDPLHISYRQIGRKAMAVNLSDIAAMAGRPLNAMVSLGVPLHSSLENAEELMAGLLQHAHEYQTAVIGGDTTVTKGPYVINVAVMGEATGAGPVLRSGAQAGDALFVTGPLGGSIEEHHWLFTPRLREAQWLHQKVDLHAMIDLSDGLAADLRHILTASQKGCELWSDRIPLSDAARSATDGLTPLERALGDGEDFELLLTVSESDAEILRHQDEVPLYEIGVIVEDPTRVVLKDESGTEKELPDLGWKHVFK